MDYSTYDMTFTDRELEDFLNLIQQQEGAAAEMDHTASSSGLPLQFAHGIPMNVGLQLQPHVVQPGEDMVCSQSSPVSAASSDEGNFMSSSAVYSAEVSQSKPAHTLSGNSFPPVPHVPVKSEEAVFSMGPVAMATDTSNRSLTLDNVPAHTAMGTSTGQTQAMQGHLHTPGHPLLSPVASYGLPMKQEPPMLVSQLSASGGVIDRNGPGGHANGNANGKPTSSHTPSAIAAADAEAAEAFKQQISHSSVEKQRRDRLNSLIDELSNIVPASNPKYANEGTTVRRPKHVILSDTINLLKQLQDKLKLDEEELVTLKQHSAVPTNSGTNSGTAGEAPLELPQPPHNLPMATGVIVEHGKEQDCLYVKVNCRDRRGLLGDIVLALKMLPLVIRTAAVTTTKDGNVCDVFEVKLDDVSVTAEDIQCAVHAALYSQNDKHTGKRLRNEVMGS